MRQLLILLCFASPVFADDRASARTHFNEGTKAFDLGLYDQAVTEYMAAYQAKNDPALLYNIAQAHRLAGHLKEALRFYRVYLQRLPQAENRAEVAVKMSELKQAIADQERAQSELPPDHALPPQKEPVEAPQPPAPQPPLVVRPRDGGREKRIAGLSVGAVGVGALAVGIAFGVLAQQASDDLSSASHAGGAFDPARYDQGKTDQIVEGVMLGVGAAAVVTGVVLYVIGHREGKRPPSLAWSF